MLPPKLLGSPYPVFVPKTDADGNDVAGIRMPEVAVPVATYIGLGIAAPTGSTAATPPASRSPLPRPKPSAWRPAIRGPRCEERYADHATYVSQVTRAAQDLKAQRLLLDEDVAAYVAAAQAASVP